MNRLSLCSGASVLVASLVWVGAGGLAAQSPGASTYNPPRMPDGKPDLQGIYDVATITPVERPQEYTGKPFLTEEEVASMVAYEKERAQKDLEPVDPNRAAPPVGGDKSPTKSYLEGVFRAGGGTVGGYNLIWVNPGSAPINVNGEYRTSIVIDPPDGRIPPMKPEAVARRAAALKSRVDPGAAESGGGGPAAQFDGPEARPLAERCLLGFGSTSGPPTLPNYFYNNLKQIVQTPDRIMILNEMVHDARIIRMNAKHQPAHVRLWMGDSIGRWEGDTLVVETTNFTDKTQFRGSGDQLKVTERFTRTGDKTLLYRFTVEDPATWDRPWTGEYPWVASSESIFEYACHEGNYALETVLKGARVADKPAPRTAKPAPARK